MRNWLHTVNCIIIAGGQFISVREGTLDYNLHKYPKFYKLKTLGTWLKTNSVKTFQPIILIYMRGNFLIIIGDVYKSFVHCLIP